MLAGNNSARHTRLQNSCCLQGQRCLRLGGLTALNQLSTAEVHITRPPMKLDPLSPNEVWYLAYGSNMNPKTLTGRRMVRPRQSLPCKVPQHILSFDVLGFPYAEPGFATIVPLQPHMQQQAACQHTHGQQQQTALAGSRSGSYRTSCVHGVLHRLTKREWQVVQASEGVGSKDVGYQVVTVNCQLYDGQTTVQAQTLQSAAASMHSSNRQALPSQRYLRLLQEGARHHQLDPGYQHWLASLPAYQPADMLQRTLGTVASGAVLAAATVPALPVYLATRALGWTPELSTAAGKHNKDIMVQQQGNEGSGPNSSDSTTVSSHRQRSSQADVVPFISWYANQAQNLTWWVHDSVMSSVLGSGCSNDGPGIS